jgi:chaperonin GroES
MEDEDEQEYGELIELEGQEEDDVEDTEDGGAIVRLDEEDPKAGESEFYANLADGIIPEPELGRLSSRFLDLISKDKDARKKRDDQYDEGLRRTGLGDDAPGGADFQGASKVVHPMLTEACIDFAARAMKEIFPPQGPAKDFVPGKPTDKKLDKAKRKTNLLNWQMTVQCPEVRAELEQLMTQVPLGGAQYLKLGWDEAKNRPEFLFVAIDDMYLPFAATNFYTAQRRTHVQYLTQLDYENRVKNGMYRDVDLTPAGMEPEMSVAAQANDKIEGREQTSFNEDGLRIVYEIYAIADVEGDGAAPYIISVDKPSGKVLSIYRNWDEEDEHKEELLWFVEFPFIPWRGAYPIGLPHMIGGLSGAATGALRALLDSAHISNSQTMLKLKGGTAGGQSLSIQPTQTIEIEGGLNVDDVRKLAMPLPYNPPSPVLMNLLGFLVDAGKGVVRTAMDDIADGNPNAPVGTTLAKIEQGMVVFSSIHARLHDAMARMLRILHRLNGMYLDDERLEREAGEELATRKDFEGPLDVVPVSDPNIFSEAQRYAQVQALAQRAQALPQLYNMRAVEERLLETLKVPNPKELLVPPMEPKDQNAVNENVAATLGRPITAFPDQDHIAHLKTHLAYMMSPTFGMSPMIAPAFLPVMLNHIKEHVALWYAASVFDVSNEALGEDVGDMMKELGKDTEGRKALDQMLAEAGAAVVQRGGEIFSDLPQVVQQAQQVMQQFAPQPMQDPRLALETQKLQAETQRDQMRMQQDAQQAQLEAQMDQQRMQLEQQKMQVNAQQDQQDNQIDMAELQLRMQIEQQQQKAEDARKAAELQARMTMNSQDNQTAMQLAAAEIASGEQIAVSTGTGINPNP